MPEKFPQPEPQPDIVKDIQSLALKTELNDQQKNYLDQKVAQLNQALNGRTTQQMFKEQDVAGLEKYLAICQQINYLLKNQEIKQTELEKELDAWRKYNESVESLKASGVAQLLPESQQYGIIDINGNESPMPSYEEFQARLNANAELLKEKVPQGLNEFLMVPIGAPLSFLIAKTGELIVKKHQEGKLLATDGTKLDLRMVKGKPDPVDVDDIYKNADITGDLVYYPKKFDQANHGGKSKKELIEETGSWQIILIEDLPNLPAEGEGKEIKGRKQLEAKQSPIQYLETIQTDKYYDGEALSTPEAQLTYFMQYLQQHDQVIDDWQGNGKACWNAGAYFKGESGGAPLARWNRDSSQFRLTWNNPGYHRGNYGVRAAVRI